MSILYLDFVFRLDYAKLCKFQNVPQMKKGFGVRNLKFGIKRDCVRKCKAESKSMSFYEGIELKFLIPIFMSVTSINVVRGGGTVRTMKWFGCLIDSTSINGIPLIFNTKDTASFHFGRQNSGTNLDLAILNVNSYGRLGSRTNF